MSKLAKWDQTRARDLYLQGLPPARIAAELGISPGALAAAIKRHRWAAAKRDLSLSFGERGKRWREKAAMAVERLLDAFRLLPDQRLRALARADVQSLRDIVATGMEVYGLDRDQPGARVQVAVYDRGGWVRVDSGGAPESRSAECIDVASATCDAQAI
jgi:hypothetical protein